MAARDCERVGCLKYKSILSFPCGRRVSDMRVLLVTHCEWLFIFEEVKFMKTGIFKTKYRTAEGRFTCSWLMILGKCLFVKHKKAA